MSDTVSFAELNGQHLELLPARTVLSMFSAQDGGLPPILDSFYNQVINTLGIKPGSEASGAAGGTN